MTRQFGLLSLILVGGCTRPPVAKREEKSGEAFLKWSMDRFHAMPSLRADDKVQISGDTVPAMEETRTVAYGGLNRFRVTSRIGPNGLVAVSDGRKLLEYDPAKPQAIQYPAPRVSPRCKAWQ